MSSSKKQSDNVLPFAERMNFGLLSIATYVERHGYSSEVYDPQCMNAEKALADTLNWLMQRKPRIIGLSCISGFSYDNLLLFSEAIRKQFSDVLIVTGGQDHVGKIPEIVLQECPAIDVVTSGEGEYSTLALLDCRNARKGIQSLCSSYDLTVRCEEGIVKSAKGMNRHFNEMQKLDFSLYADCQRFPPSVEIGRGCPFRCNFCSNGTRPYLKKSMTDVVDEVENVCSFYESSCISFYFQTPLMKLADEELVSLAKEREERGLQFTWRSQTRVDTLEIHQLELLHKAGCRALDLGFESGSHEMLVAMGKTKNPSAYLSKAASLLREAKQVGIIIKLNVLFYAGERTSTLAETFTFLSKNSETIHSISAYPLLVFPETDLEEKISNTLACCGGKVRRDEQWTKRHIYPVDSSNKWSYEKLSEFGIKLGKAFQTSKEYYAQRSCGYYAPTASYEEFIKHVIDVIDVFPFANSELEMFNHRKELANEWLISSQGDATKDEFKRKWI